jgi:outer membrane protein assembly factor BamB
VNRGPSGEHVRVAAVCGKTGRILWQSADLTGTAGGKVHSLREQFLFLTPVRLKPDEVPAAVGLSIAWGNEWQVRYYLFALSGSDGRLLWQTPVGPEIMTNGLSSPTGAPAASDLDGDGVKDLVFWAGPHHLIAVSGATGRVLWEHEVLGGANGQIRWNTLIFYWDTERVDYPAPAVADLDGKGTFGIAFAHRPKDRDCVVVLNGKDGTERWAWEGPQVRKATEFNPADAVTEPRFVRLREGTFLLGVACGTAPPRMKGFSPGLSRHLVLLDITGKEYQRRELPGPDYINAVLAPLPLWVADLDDDGFDEIAFGADDANRFIVTRGGLRDEAWSLTCRDRESLLAIRAGAGGKPGTVVFRTENTVRGLDGKTGRALWACSGVAAGPWLPPSDPAALPIVVFPTSAHGTVARRAVPVARDGKFLAPGVK